MSPHDENERLLASRAADGDGAAIERLYDLYEQKLFNFCNRITANREDAADASQEAFCNVIQRLPGVDTGQLNFGAYLFTAARNACLDIIAQRKRTVVTDVVPEDTAATLPVELDPERATLTGEQMRAARAASAGLPEKQREVLALREVAELSYDDIAAAMDMNSNAVAQLISRARLNFHKQLRAGAVVLPPLDEAGERAIELAVARQDGKIAEADREWLERHLRENEASRINVEAIHEAGLIYRAIAPIAAVAGLREATISTAKASVVGPEGGAPADAASGDGSHAGSGAGSDQVTAPLATGASAAGASGDDPSGRTNAGDDAGSSERDPAAANDTRDAAGRRRRRAAATILALLLLAGGVAVATAGDDAPSVTEPAAEAVTPSGATGEPRSSKSKKDDSAGSDSQLKQDSGSQNTQPNAGNTKQLSGDTGEKPRRKRDRKKQPAADPAPDTPPPSDPAPDTPPAEPTGPTKPPSGPPGGPGEICASPPCTPPPPVP